MRRLILSLFLVIAFAVPAWAEDFTREQIEQIVREFIQKNPEVMIESVEKYGQRQQEQENKAASEKVQENKNWLFKNKNHAEAGNPKGDVTIVEFFDYNCGYCKQALGDLMTLLDSDKNLRLIFVEIPILGESSNIAAKWALAAHKQGLYLEYHVALMRHKGPLNEGVFVKYAEQVGLNVEQMRKDMVTGGFPGIIDENLRMARTLGIQGTPAFVIGDELVRGYVGMSGLQEAISAARAKK